ncbi:MAG: 3-phosphoshikimate 1-carboxyvinyltransferase [Deltaproteobacteria bacterium]
MQTTVRKSGPLKGEIIVAPDKSISHRAVIFSALARGVGTVSNFLLAEDTLSSCSCVRQLGIEIKQDGSSLQIYGRGLHGLSEPASVLDCGNSGTTMRLLAGLLAGQPFFSVLCGDQSLNRRPMKRVMDPLRAMGADIWARQNGQNPPLAIKGAHLKGLYYKMPIASAQVKSAVILAGLDADGDSVIIEPERSRDHTENMLRAMGADISVNGHEIILRPGKELDPQDFLVPGDISSAAFFIVAASLVPGSELLIRDIGINKTRDGVIDVMRQMGGRIDLHNRRIIGGEEVADMVVSSSSLKGVTIKGEIIPRLIDEIPILAVAMAFADGQSIVEGAHELRVKETDRIAAICSELGKLGCMIEEREDGFIIQGNPSLIERSQENIQVESHGDHRIAMSLAVAGLCLSTDTRINGTEAVSISFPGFWDLMEGIRS